MKLSSTGNPHARRLGLCSAYSLLYGVRKPGELAAVVRETGAEITAIEGVYILGT
jgi:hypothetical protein